MCGIYGTWNIDGGPLNLESLRTSTCLMRHRGPDDEGYLLVDTRKAKTVPCRGKDTCNELGLMSLEQGSAEMNGAHDLAFGFRRLAILDTSAAGHQPMRSHDGRFWIAFNGEIYNYVELRDELLRSGCVFKTGTDTEVLITAYEKWGEECLNRFNGMWAFAIWDNAERKLFLARDRFGVKPLYHTCGLDRKFSFASEIKALAGDSAVPFEPDGQAVHNYLVSGRMPSAGKGDTFFRNVRSVPPGSCITMRGDGKIHSRRYWALRTEDSGNTDCDENSIVEEYRRLFMDSVRIRLRSDVPIGSCLSGGVDSSAIVCAVKRLLKQNEASDRQVGDHLKTFTATYGQTGPFNERPFAEQVVAATGSDGNYVVPKEDGLMSDLQRLIWHQDEPIQSTSMFAQWCVMEKAHLRGIKVLLDGQGADEVLAGYRPYLPFLSSLLGRRRFGQALAEARQIAPFAGRSRWRLLARAMFEHAPGNLAGKWNEVRSRQPGRLCILNPDFNRQHGVQPGLRSKTNTTADLSEFLKEQIEETSLPDLLRYEDRNSMAFSVESRLPFLDYRLVEFSFRRAGALRIKNGWTKWVLRKAMEAEVPEEVIWRRDKIGFETPEADWMRAICKSMGDSLGNGTSLSSYLDVERVRTKLTNWPVDNTPREDLLEVWRCFSLDQWLHAFAAPRSGSAA